MSAEMKRVNPDWLVESVYWTKAGAKHEVHFTRGVRYEDVSKVLNRETLGAESFFTNTTNMSQPILLDNNEAST